MSRRQGVLVEVSQHWLDMGLGLVEPRWSTDSRIHRLSSSNTTNHLLDIGWITFEDGLKPWNYISLVAPWIQGQYTLVHRIPRIKLTLVQHSVLILYILHVGEAEPEGWLGPRSVKPIGSVEPGSCPILAKFW